MHPKQKCGIQDSPDLVKSISYITSNYNEVTHINNNFHIKIEMSNWTIHVQSRSIKVKDLKINKL